MILEIHNKAEAVKYGAKAGWCTAKDSRYYHDYYAKDKGRLFVIFKPNRKHPSFQLFLPNSGIPELRAKLNKPVSWKAVCEANPSVKSQSIFDASLLDGLNERISGGVYSPILVNESHIHDMQRGGRHMDISQPIIPSSNFSEHLYGTTALNQIQGLMFLLGINDLQRLEFVIEFSTERNLEYMATQITARADCSIIRGHEFRVSDYIRVSDIDMQTTDQYTILRDVARELKYRITSKILREIRVPDHCRELDIMELTQRLAFHAARGSIQRSHTSIVLNNNHMEDLQIFLNEHLRGSSLRKDSISGYEIEVNDNAPMPILIPNEFL